METALREAEEETALNRSRVEVLCTLPRVYTPHNGGTAVTPVVAELKGSPDTLSLTPNPQEVECVFWVPLETFLGSSQITSKYRRPMPGEGIWWSHVAVEHRDSESGQTHAIWGLTGIICAIVSAIALNQEPAFPFKGFGITDLARTETSLKVTFQVIPLTTRKPLQPTSKL